MLSYGQFPCVRILVMKNTYPPTEMEKTECPETSAYKIQTPGESPRRKHTAFRTPRKFEIKKNLSGVAISRVIGIFL